MFKQRDLRVGVAEGHIGDLLRGGREARRHHEIVAAREIAHVAAVHVHDREPLAPLLGRAGLVDEDDMGVEKALLAGDLREDRVADEMGDAPAVGGVGHIVLAGDLLAGRDVPQPEVGGDMGGVAVLDAPGDDELGVDRLPGVEIGPHVRIGDLLGKARRADRFEKHRPREIVGEDVGELDRAVVARQRRHRDHDRFEIGPDMHGDVALGARGERRGEAEGERGDEAEQLDSLGHGGHRLSAGVSRQVFCVQVLCGRSCAVRRRRPARRACVGRDGAIPARCPGRNAPSSFSIPRNKGHIEAGHGADCISAPRASNSRHRRARRGRKAG